MATTDNSKTTLSFGGILLPGLTLLFTYLKLTNQIDWSWWAVTAPVWGPFAVAAVLFVLALLLMTIYYTGRAIVRKPARR